MAPYSDGEARACKIAGEACVRWEGLRAWLWMADSTLRGAEEDPATKAGQTN